MSPSNVHLQSLVNEDGAAVLDTTSGTLTTMNPTGAYIWHALDRGEQEQSIVKRLADETGEPLDRVAQDVQAFLTALRNQKLLPTKIG